MGKNDEKLHNLNETVWAIFIIVLVSLFILANFLVRFSWPLFAVAMALGFLISLRYPKSGFLAIIFLTMVWERFFTLQSFFVGKVEYKLYPLDILMLGIIGGLVIQWLENKIKRIKFNATDWFLVLFIIINIAYFIFSAFILKSSTYLAFSSLKNYAFYSLFYFIALYLFPKASDWRQLLHFFLAGAVAIVGFIIFGIASGSGLWTEYTPLSTEGVRILAFTHGLYLSLAIFPVIFLLVFRKDLMEKYRPWPQILLLAWTVGIAGMLMRHLWVAILIALFLAFILLPKKSRPDFRRLIFGFAILVLSAAIFTFYFSALLPQSEISAKTNSISGALLERTKSISQFRTDESFSWRNLVWSGAYHELRQDIISGIGTGKLIYVESENYRDYVEIRNIHNSYLSVFIQLGLLGFLPLVIFLFFSVKNVWQIKNEKIDLYKFSVLAIIAVYLVALMFQPYLETNLLAIFFWISLGLGRQLTEIKN